MSQSASATANAGGRPLRLNIGCGQSPTPGWRNYDNSVTVRVARSPVLFFLARRLGLMSTLQIEFAETCRIHDIRYATATAIPERDRTVDVIYSSHMLEHLDRDEAREFLDECHRVLKPGGTLRVLVPNFHKEAMNYFSGRTNLDLFLRRMEFDYSKPRGWRQRLRRVFVGHRGHYWMYDPPTLALTVEACGFTDVQMLEDGQTTMSDPGGLNLAERPGSASVEAKRPG